MVWASRHEVFSIMACASGCEGFSTISQVQIPSNSKLSHSFYHIGSTFSCSFECFLYAHLHNVLRFRSDNGHPFLISFRSSPTERRTIGTIKHLLL